MLRLYRAGVVVLAAWMLHDQARWIETQRPPPVSLRQARQIFPQANRVRLSDADRGLSMVLDARGEIVGCLLTTSPQADHIIGYSGPNNVLVALDAEGAITALEWLTSGDTKEHVAKIRSQPGFLGGFTGWRPDKGEAPAVAAVSGATLTSMALAEALQWRLAGAAPSLRFPDPVQWSEVRALFTNGAAIEEAGAGWRVRDASGRLLGTVLRTSPQADHVSGYRGPTENLVALDPEGRSIVGVSFRKSYDTDSYVEQVGRSEGFKRFLVGRSVEELLEVDLSKEKVDGVSGATRTADAVVISIQRRLNAERASQAQAGARWWKPRDLGLGAVVLGGMLLAFTSWRGRSWVRWIWQAVLIGYVGFINHDLLSLALLTGWARHGVAWQAAPSLVLLVGASLLVPWTARRQLYCHHLCPHGALQIWLGKACTLRWRLPHRLTRMLEAIPALLLLGVFLLVLTGSGLLDPVDVEAFDAWSWRTTGLASLAIAVVGLACSLFVPQAYCRFGCPTGALLNFTRAAGSADHWGRRDWIALGFLMAGVLTAGAVRSWPRPEPEPPMMSFQGTSMGVDWSVTIRDEWGDPGIVERALAAEFRWAEQLVSTDRTNSEIAEFNRARTTEAKPVPWPVVTLSRAAAEIGRASEGAFDITTGQLTRLWDARPQGLAAAPPTDAEVRAALATVGWDKLEVLDGLWRKHDPDLEVDLRSIAKGWVIDETVKLIDGYAFTNYWVRLGDAWQARGAWSLELKDPERRVTLTNEAMAVSRTLQERVGPGGGASDPLIDPRDGRPVSHSTVSVCVRHENCIQADAWATALNVMGVETGLPLAERLGLAAQFVLRQDGGRWEVRSSSAWIGRERIAGTLDKKGN